MFFRIYGGCFIEDLLEPFVSEYGIKQFIYADKWHDESKKECVELKLRKIEKLEMNF